MQKCFGFDLSGHWVTSESDDQNNKTNKNGYCEFQYIFFFNQFTNNVLANLARHL